MTVTERKNCLAHLGCIRQFQLACEARFSFSVTVGMKRDNDILWVFVSLSVAHHRLVTINFDYLSRRIFNYLPYLKQAFTPSRTYNYAFTFHLSLISIVKRCLGRLRNEYHATFLLINFFPCLRVCDSVVQDPGE